MSRKILTKDYYHSQQMDVSDFIDSIKHKFQYIGEISFDFRL